jgi:hypothetical protein
MLTNKPLAMCERKNKIRNCQINYATNSRGMPKDLAELGLVKFFFSLFSSHQAPASDTE